MNSTLSWLGEWWRDLRHQLRVLSKNRAFAATVITTIAIGSGAAIAIFSVVDAVLLRPLPYEGADRLVRPLRRTGPVSVGELADLGERSKTLTHVTGYANDFKTLTGHHLAARLEGWRVEPVLFEMLKVRPLLGRTFDAAEAAPGQNNVVILSHKTWLRHYEGDREIVGKTVALDNIPHTVIGVLPAGFEFPVELANWDYWVPLVLDRTSEAGRRARIPGLAKLAKETSIEAATAEINAILRDPTRPEESWRLVHFRDELVRPVKPALTALAVGAGLLFLITCANTTGLMLVRLAVRKREIAIRAALGAARGRLFRHLLAESLLLAVLGGMAGTLVAAGAIGLLKVLGSTLTRMDSSPVSSVPRLSEVSIDARVLGFAVAICLAIGLISGLFPVLRSSRVRNLAIPHDTGTAREHKGRMMLVVAEIAMTVALVVCGGLLIHSFFRLTSVKLGYNPSNVLTFQVASRPGRYPGEQIRTFAETLTARIRSTPGVTAASYTVVLPLTRLLRDSAGIRRVPEVPQQRMAHEDDATARFVGENYLEAMGMRIVAGRGFNSFDREGSMRVVVINQSLARRLFPGEDPIGQNVYLQRQKEPWQIAGIIEDVRHAGYDQNPESQVFVNIRQWPGLAPGLRFLQYYVVRTLGDPAALTQQVRGTLRELDREAALYNVVPMEQLVDNSVSGPRLNAAVAGALGFAAMTLAAIGLYGLIAYSVASRTREIGIRMAVGAQRSGVMLLVLREGLTLAVSGITLGAAGALAVTRYLETMLFEVTPLDPATFVSGALLLLIVAAAASCGPARRAAGVDPLEALRHE